MAIAVVTKAIKTAIVKKFWEMTPMSRPMLTTTISINPRVFIRTPIAAASRQEKRTARALIIAPPNLPTIATMMTSAQQSHSVGVVSMPMFIRSPVTAKKSGRKIMLMPRICSASFSFFGMIAPARNAPNSA